MLSICLASRKSGNLSSKLNVLLDSIVAFTSPEEKKQLEVILKFDSDDGIPDYIVHSKYPFMIKYLSYSRCEGRYDLYNFINYMTTLRDDRSRFLMTIADDFTVRRPFVSEILSNQSTYRIIGGANNDIVGDRIIIPLGANHRNRQEWERSIGAYCPIIGVNLLKCVMNFGISPSTDAWAVALALATFKLYNVNIWVPMNSFYSRNEVYDLPENVGKQPEHHKSAFPYNQLDIMNHRHAYNPRVWEIIESQAKNIYLNMKADGEIAS